MTEQGQHSHNLTVNFTHFTHTQQKATDAKDAKVAHYQEKKALKAEAKQVAQAQAQIMNNNGAGLIGMRSLNVGGNGGSKEPRKEKWTPCGDNGYDQSLVFSKLHIGSGHI